MTSFTNNQLGVIDDIKTHQQSSKITHYQLKNSNFSRMKLPIIEEYSNKTHNKQPRKSHEKSPSIKSKISFCFKSINSESNCNSESNQGRCGHYSGRIEGSGTCSKLNKKKKFTLSNSQRE